VEVLLSTYNGEKYLAEQLESVWRQTYPEVWLSVRDDGSSDATMGVLDRLLAGRPRTKVVMGAHLGAAQSFMSLLRSVSPETAYVAFCDQDDVWLPDKLEAAVSGIEHFEGPAMYCSAVTLVTEDLAEVRVHRRCVRGPSFENALVENIATGCTIVLNRPAVDLLASQQPKKLVMHDAWCYLVVAGCGEVVYDRLPHALYRLHRANTVGVGTTLWAEWSGRAKRQLEQGQQRVLTAQAEELSELYGALLKKEAQRSLGRFLDSQRELRSRLVYALVGNVHKQRVLDELLYRILYASKLI